MLKCIYENAKLFILIKMFQVGHNVMNISGLHLIKAS